MSESSATLVPPMEKFKSMLFSSLRPRFDSVIVEDASDPRYISIKVGNFGKGPNGGPDPDRLKTSSWCYREIGMDHVSALVDAGQLEDAAIYVTERMSASMGRR